MSYPSWSALKIAIFDAIADSVAGSPCTGEYTIGTRTLKYRSYDELIRLYNKVCILADKESGPRKSYGRFRGFQ